MQVKEEPERSGSVMDQRETQALLPNDSPGHDSQLLFPEDETLWESHEPCEEEEMEDDPVVEEEEAEEVMKCEEAISQHEVSFQTVGDDEVPQAEKEFGMEAGEESGKGEAKEVVEASAAHPRLKKRKIEKLKSKAEFLSPDEAAEELRALSVTMEQEAMEVIHKKPEVEVVEESQVPVGDEVDASLIESDNEKSAAKGVHKDCFFWCLFSCACFSELLWCRTGLLLLLFQLYQAVCKSKLMSKSSAWKAKKTMIPIL